MIKNGIASLFVFLAVISFSSCGSESDDQIDDGGLIIDPTGTHLGMDDDSSKVQENNKMHDSLQKIDSTRIADSISRNTNPIRDFN
ncbi:hypothetical protein BH09BAC5_BH09BAC5_29630 [soil metagenome]